MFVYKMQLSLLFIVLLSIWGCGTMAKEDESLSVPQKVSIDMPKALEAKSSTRKKLKKFSYFKEDENKSSAYLELKEDVKFLEEQRISLEVNLLFINEVIDKVDSRCKNMPQEERCIIEEDSLTFVFDENLSNRLKKLTSEDLGYELGDVLSFGEIEFVEHTTQNKYSYSLKIDTAFEDEKGISFERISWSKDEKLIFSEYIEESVEEKSSIVIDFSKKEDNSKQIVTDNSFFNKVDSSSDVFHFEMLKKSDEVETYELNSTSLATDSDAKKNSFSSVGKLSNLGGYLNFTGEFDSELFKENDSFDGNGNIITSSYCYSGMDCDLEDEDSWFDF